MAGEHRWMAFFNVSASGPLGMWADRDRPLFYSKEKAQLEYTHADASYYSQFWQEGGWPWPDELTRLTNHDLIGAQFSDVQNAFGEAAEWFAREAEEDLNFDGGAIHFTFSGHGREDGVLMLERDTFFSPSDLVELALKVHEATDKHRHTNLVVYLDSCHSGGFLLDLIDIVLSEHRNKLHIFRATASCYPDELSYEVPEIGHGLATFCASIRPHGLDSLLATAGLKRLPLWYVLWGPGGCSLVTMGKQNPISIGQYGEVEACNRDLNLYVDDWRPRSRTEWETDLYAARDEFRAAVGALYNRSVESDDETGLKEYLMTLGPYQLRRGIS